MVDLIKNESNYPRIKMSALLEVNELNFTKEVLEHSGLVLVDFGAAWCSPCLKMLPILESFAQNNKDKIKVVKIDIDNSPTLASSYSIRSVPTLILFKNGVKVEFKVGMTNLSDLNSLLVLHSV